MDGSCPTVQLGPARVSIPEDRLGALIDSPHLFRPAGLLKASGSDVEQVARVVGEALARLAVEVPRHVEARPLELIGADQQHVVEYPLNYVGTP